MTHTQDTFSATVTVSEKTYTFEITRSGTDFQCLLNGDLDSVLVASLTPFGTIRQWLYLDIDGDSDMIADAIIHQVLDPIFKK